MCKYSHIKLIMFIVTSNIFLRILIFVYLPKKNNYKLKHFTNVMSDNFGQLNNNTNNTNQYLILENQLKTSSRVNQAVLGFSIIIFILLILMIALFIFNICNEDAVFFIIIIKFFFELINWSMALSIVAKVNRIRKDENLY